MWSSVLPVRTEILDKFSFLIFLWITLRFKTNYAQVYPEGHGRILGADKNLGQKKPDSSGVAMHDVPMRCIW